jgi:carnitine 3-dehydrogenase
MDTMTEPDVNKRVAIIGAGLIGCSWAALFLKHGWDVRIWDHNPDIYESVSAKVMRALEDLDKLHETQIETGSFALCDDLDIAISDVSYVQENVPENLNVKHALFAELDKRVAPTASDCILHHGLHMERSVQWLFAQRSFSYRSPVQPPAFDPLGRTLLSL